ncbi:sporulation protein YlmC with PRC-barrel domain [Bradyrhizobium sp. USDA 336]
MLMKSIVTGLAGTALLATVAIAQTPPAATTDKAAPAATATTTTASGQWRTSKMDGLKVYNEANENIGTINDLLMDKNGDIKIAVIGVGGFLGMGEHLVAVPYEKLKFVNEPVAYTGTGANTGARPRWHDDRRCDRYRQARSDRIDVVRVKMVSGPRRVQCQQGRAEEHAAVQVRGVMRLA